MNKNKELDRLERRIKRLRKQIRQVARQIGRCWDLLQKRPNYVEPPMELDIRNMIRVSKM